MPEYSCIYQCAGQWNLIELNKMVMFKSDLIKKFQNAFKSLNISKRNVTYESLFATFAKVKYAEVSGIQMNAVMSLKRRRYWTPLPKKIVLVSSFCFLYPSLFSFFLCVCLNHISLPRPCICTKLHNTHTHTNTVS